MRVRHRSIVDAPIEAVWPHVADFGGVAKWSSDLASSELVGEGPLAPGVERVCVPTRPMFGMQEVRERLVEIRPGRALTYEVAAGFGPFRSARNTWTLDALGARTRLTFDARFEPAGPLGTLAAPLFWPAIRWLTRRAGREFARYVARQAPR